MSYAKMGRLTKEVELKDAGSVKVANFSLAVDRARKREGQPDVDFIPCTVFGKAAEAMAAHCVKGQTLFIEGDWQNDTYNDKDGKKRDKWNVYVNNVVFGPKPGSAPVDDEIPFA